MHCKKLRFVYFLFLLMSFSSPSLSFFNFSASPSVFAIVLAFTFINHRAACMCENFQLLMYAIVMVSWVVWAKLAVLHFALQESWA